MDDHIHAVEVVPDSPDESVSHFLGDFFHLGAVLEEVAFGLLLGRGDLRAIPFFDEDDESPDVGADFVSEVMEGLLIQVDR